MINEAPIPDVAGGDVSRISATERHYRQDRKRIRELEREVIELRLALAVALYEPELTE